MQRSIVWFKTDLRLQDNETFWRAVNSGSEVIPIYCLDDLHFKTSEYGFKKTGRFRAKFLLECLLSLDTELRKLGSGLLLVKGKPEQVLCQLIEKYKAETIYAKLEVAPEEKLTEKRLVLAAFKMGCAFDCYDTSTLFDAQDLPFTIAHIPDVFTEFRKAVEKKCTVRPLFEKPFRIKSPEIPPLALPELKALGLEQPVVDHRAVMDFKGGEGEAWRRLNQYFFETFSVSNYKHTRNGMLGRDYSSKFSPWLSLGCISARQIYYELKRYEAQFGANDSTYWLIFELLWRDYFRFMMEKHGHKYFLKNGLKQPNRNTEKFNPSDLHKWVEGKTGNDFVDAHMTELNLTGFMSNRGRQNVASYLVNDLQVDWRFGAAYFEQQLVDYDVCSNWGNWAYVAGVGNDPRGKRYFNIEKQAMEYDAEKFYRVLWSANNHN